MTAKSSGIRRKRQSRAQRSTKFIKIFVSPREKKLIQQLADRHDKSDSGFLADLLLPIVERLAADTKEGNNAASAANGQ